MFLNSLLALCLLEVLFVLLVKTSSYKLQTGFLPQLKKTKSRPPKPMYEYRQCRGNALLTVPLPFRTLLTVMQPEIKRHDSLFILKCFCLCENCKCPHFERHFNDQ